MSGKTWLARWLARLVCAGYLWGIHGLALGDAGTVYFHAWGGSPQINQYIAWVADKVHKRHGIALKHVKLSDTSHAVSLVLSQKQASADKPGTVDLLWVNGENFASMAKHGLLQPSWVSELSNFARTNPERFPDVLYDFGVATEGRESPWGRASLIFYHNSKHLPQPPTSLPELLAWSAKQPFRFTYPHVDDFIGISFVKYALIASVRRSHKDLEQKLYKPLQSAEDFDLVTLPLWTFLDALHPLMWRRGAFFVRDNGWLKRIFGDEETLLAMTFSAGDIPASVDRFELPKSTRSFAMHDGMLGNIHFVAIPFNAPNREAAKQVANFLLSPEAQAHKQKSEVWGDATVLDMAMLSEREQALFTSGTVHPSAFNRSADISVMQELHPSWIPAIKEKWKERYIEH